MKVKEVHLTAHKIAGVKTPKLEKVDFDLKEMSYFNEAGWISEGIKILKDLSILQMKKEIAIKKCTVLEFARKKTTQKVNLYEKVQIPDYQEAILKIKRFLEDAENLSKASQKILKARLAAQEELENQIIEDVA